MTFSNFARSLGLEIKQQSCSDRIVRCGTIDKPRSTNGAFWFDGKRGWACNWQTDGKVHWYHDQHSSPWTDAEKLAWKKRQELAREEQESLYAHTARTAHSMLQNACLEKHEYLKSKGFPDEKGLVLNGKELLIPMRNIKTNALQSVQRIFLEDNTWKKKMLLHGKAKDAVYRIGRGQKIYLCEGYATGLSIAAAMKLNGNQATVIVCFSAKNLVSVAGHTKGIVCADNDTSETGQKAAIATGLPWTMPAQEGQDFNDLHQTDGIFAVAKALKEIRA